MNIAHPPEYSPTRACCFLQTAQLIKQYAMATVDGQGNERVGHMMLLWRQSLANNIFILIFLSAFASSSGRLVSWSDVF